MDEALPMRGRWIFRQYAWTDRNERDMHWIERGAFVAVEREARMTWCTRGDHLGTLLLRAWYGPITTAYWSVCVRMWAWGLIEPHEAAVFSWRRDFRPFPWRGLRRER